MVQRMELISDETVYILIDKDIAGSISGYTLPPGVYEITDNNLMLNSLLPNEGKIKNTIGDIRLRPKLNNNKAIKFIKKSFFARY